VADEEMDYRPRPERKGRKAPPARPAARPVRRDKPARRSGHSTRFWRNKWFWRAAAVFGLIVLVGVPVVAELTQVWQTSPQEEWDAILQRLNRNPEDTDALLDLGNFYYRQGQALRDQGDYERAVANFVYAADSYARVLQLRPDSSTAIAAVRLALHDVGTGLLARANVPVHNDPSDPAEAALAFEEAANFYRDALADEPANAGLARMLAAALYYQGLAYQELGQQSLALEAWQSAAAVAAGDWYYVQQAHQLVQQYRGP